MHGETPYIVRAGQEDYKRLFYSDPEIASKIPITIPGGFGIIKAGTIMAKVSESTSRLGYAVPYTPEGISVGLTTYPGLSYLVTDGATSTSVYVTMADSYKFAVGDHLAASDTNTDGASAIDLGAITAIDRSTYPHMALITVTNNVTTAITVAQGGAVWHQTTTSAPFTYATGILLGSVDTGSGANCKGALGTLVKKNAILYKGLLTGYDSEALTDLGGAEDGQFLII